MHVTLTTAQSLWTYYLVFGGVFGGFCMGLRAGEEKTLPAGARMPFIGLFFTAAVGLLFWPAVITWWAWKALRS